MFKILILSFLWLPVLSPNYLSVLITIDIPDFIISGNGSYSIPCVNLYTIDTPALYLHQNHLDFLSYSSIQISII
ncbi:hypothetical protein AE937_13890 [Bacteroides fragilis]|uniref:Uncharacterized protein n=1 Tax=Bacteroides fragilis TaxID=817 RepID=A0A413K5W4_BACFG|nr:hypothetical protein [Bacteroides fragilis]RGY71680.1 hypothetical protein DXA27_00290 [Bacteroides fragilis]